MYQEGSNLAALVRSAFRRHGFHELENIRCTADGDEVTLTGAVGQATLRRAAESIASSVSGVRQVHNRIQIEASNSFLRTWQSARKMRTDAGNT